MRKRYSIWHVALLVIALWQTTLVPAYAAHIAVLAHGYGKPDDLAWGPHGSIYFSDFGNSSLNRLTPDGRRTVVWAGLNGPEGIIVERGGTLVVADQGSNRIVRLDLVRHTLHVLATIPNPTGQLGIDGIALDPRDGSIIVPDSPSGRILRLSRAGRLQVLATGLGRPVGALVEGNGNIMVVDEHRNAAFRIDTQGTIRQVGGFLSVPDDVIGDGHGGFYITCLGDNTLRHLTAGGAITLVARGLINPQGVLLRANGTLVVSEEDVNLFVNVRP